MSNSGPGKIVDLDQATRLLKSGELVAFPTETVYGLGADALNKSAVAKIFSTKGRPENHPLIVHVADFQVARTWSAGFSESAVRLAKKFWPGPLTLIVKRADFVPPRVTGGQDTVGLRVPAHPVAQQLLVQFGGGIAGPSANRFGKVSPTSAQDVVEEFAGIPLAVLDGGKSTVGIESTIVDCSGNSLAILRPGFVTAEQIFECLGIMPRGRENDSPRTAGTHKSHYAPNAKVILLPEDEVDAFFLQTTRSESNRYLACFSGRPPQGKNIVWHPVPDDPAELANQLYSLFRQADAENFTHVVFVQPEQKGVGTAVADRLNRAAARFNG